MTGRKLKNGDRVEIISSRHPWLEPGMQGTVRHDNHMQKGLWFFERGDLKGEQFMHVLLAVGRDKIKFVEERNG